MSIKIALLTVLLFSCIFSEEPITNGSSIAVDSTRQHPNIVNIKKELTIKGSELEAIYITEVNEKPTLHGEVIVKIVIEADGTVSESSITKSTTQDEDFNSKIVDTIKLWKFEEADGEKITILYTFYFEQKNITREIDSETKKRLNKQIAKKSKSLEKIYDSYIDRRVNVNGLISFKINVNKEGSVANIKIVESSTGNKKFDQAILGEIRKWSFDDVKTQVDNILFKTDFRLKDQNGNRSIGVASFIPNFKFIGDSVFSCVDDSALFEELYENVKEFNTEYYRHRKTFGEKYANYSGTAVIEFYIMTDGASARTRLLSSSFTVKELEDIFVNKVRKWKFKNEFTCPIGVELTYTIIEKIVSNKKQQRLQKVAKRNRVRPGGYVKYIRTDSIPASWFVDYHAFAIEGQFPSKAKPSSGDSYEEFEDETRGNSSRLETTISTFFGLGFKTINTIGRFDFDISFGYEWFYENSFFNGAIKYHYPLFYSTGLTVENVVLPDRSFGFDREGNKYIAVPALNRNFFNISVGAIKSPREYTLSTGLNFNKITSTRIRLKGNERQYKGFRWFEVGVEALYLLATEDEIIDKDELERFGIKTNMSVQPGGDARSVLSRYNFSVGYLRGLMASMSLSISTSFYGDK